MTKKDQAQSYFDRIGDGHKHAVKRPFDQRADRILRRLIEKANHNGDCIISGFSGYYRPIPGDPVDNIEYKAYMAKEESRAKSLSEKLMFMKVAYEHRGIGCL